MIRAARLTGLPKKSPSRASTTPAWRPQRTRSGTSPSGSDVASDVCRSTVASIAQTGSVKAACTPSPSILTTRPAWRAMLSRTTASCRASERRMRSGSCSHNRLLPSISVNRNVTGPAGRVMTTAMSARHARERTREHAQVYGSAAAAASRSSRIGLREPSVERDQRLDQVELVNRFHELGQRHQPDEPDDIAHRAAKTPRVYGPRRGLDVARRIREEPRHAVAIRAKSVPELRL